MYGLQLMIRHTTDGYFFGGVPMAIHVIVSPLSVSELRKVQKKTASSVDYLGGVPNVKNLKSAAAINNSVCE